MSLLLIHFCQFSLMLLVLIPPHCELALLPLEILPVSSCLGLDQTLYRQRVLVASEGTW